MVGQKPRHHVPACACHGARRDKSKPLFAGVGRKSSQLIRYGCGSAAPAAPEPSSRMTRVEREVAERTLAFVTASLRQQVQRSRQELREAGRREQELLSELSAIRAYRQAREEELGRLDAVLEQAMGLTAGDAPSHPLPEVAENAPLSGVALREAAARAVLRRGVTRQKIHHRTWLAWLREDGWDAAGKRPEAVLQTQLSRSPLVRRADEAGFYMLDPELARAYQQRLGELHEQLQALPPPDQMSMLGDTRSRRQELEGEISRTERLAEEAWRVLAQERPPGFAGAEEDGDVLVRAWLR